LCFCFGRCDRLAGLASTRLTRLSTRDGLTNIFLKEKKTFALRMIIFDGTQENKERHHKHIVFFSVLRPLVTAESGAVFTAQLEPQCNQWYG
jgi:hypothetical protein